MTWLTGTAPNVVVSATSALSGTERVATVVRAGGESAPPDGEAGTADEPGAWLQAAISSAMAATAAARRPPSDRWFDDPRFGFICLLPASSMSRGGGARSSARGRGDGAAGWTSGEAGVAPAGEERGQPPTPAARLPWHEGPPADARITHVQSPPAPAAAEAVGVAVARTPAPAHDARCSARDSSHVTVDVRFGFRCAVDGLAVPSDPPASSGS